MPIKKYGIYVAYPPGVDLRGEGLGRYLAAFLGGASKRSGVEMVVVCPSWSRDALNKLFESEGVPRCSFEVVSPVKPYVLRIHERGLKKARTRRFGLLRKKLREGVSSKFNRLRENIEGRISEATKFNDLFVIFIYILILSLAALMVLPFAICWNFFLNGFGFVQERFSRGVGTLSGKASRFWEILYPKESGGLSLQLFRKMQSAEYQKMVSLINNMRDVRAWYCPTAFWPSFNEICAPRLMCVPDVVLMDFPLGFSSQGGEHTLRTFETIKNTIAKADYVVTYSNSVKWGTVVDRFELMPEKVSVIHHAPNLLNRWLPTMVDGAGDEIDLEKCREVLLGALRRSAHRDYLTNFRNDSFAFIFYASQFRPNKNVITLLRAYEHLLRKEQIGHKLILTGKPEHRPEITNFIAEKKLWNDVIFLPGLTLVELATCYRLADLAINPSLSEGGCPFTFNEALSVGTPVVVARIEVSKEILSDPVLDQVMYFNPYDWRDMARKISWGLENRSLLLSIELPIFHLLSERTWEDVVAEHLEVMDQLAKGSEVSGGD